MEKLFSNKQETISQTRKDKMKALMKDVFRESSREKIHLRKKKENEESLINSFQYKLLEKKDSFIYIDMGKESKGNYEPSNTFVKTNSNNLYNCRRNGLIIDSITFNSKENSSNEVHINMLFPNLNKLGISKLTIDIEGSQSNSTLSFSHKLEEINLWETNQNTLELLKLGSTGKYIMRHENHLTILSMNGFDSKFEITDKIEYSNEIISLGKSRFSDNTAYILDSNNEFHQRNFLTGETVNISAKVIADQLINIQETTSPFNFIGSSYFDIFSIDSRTNFPTKISQADSIDQLSYNNFFGIRFLENLIFSALSDKYLLFYDCRCPKYPLLKLQHFHDENPPNNIAKLFNPTTTCDLNEINFEHYSDSLLQDRNLILTAFSTNIQGGNSIFMIEDWRNSLRDQSSLKSFVSRLVYSNESLGYKKISGGISSQMLASTPQIGKSKRIIGSQSLYLPFDSTLLNIQIDDRNQILLHLLETDEGELRFISNKQEKLENSIDIFQFYDIENPNYEKSNTRSIDIASQIENFLISIKGSESVSDNNDDSNPRIDSPNNLKNEVENENSTFSFENLKLKNKDFLINNEILDFLKHQFDNKNEFNY